MNVQKLRDNYPNLISFMEQKGYSKSYVNKVQTALRRILSEAEVKKWRSYRDVYLEYEKASQSFQYLRAMRTAIGIIEQFDVYGRYPDGRRRHQLWDRGAYPQLSSEFKDVIDYYCSEEPKSGKKESTIYVESHNASTFFLYLQRLGITALEDITEDAVMSVFLSPTGERIKNCSYKKNISAVFKTAARLYPKACQKILAYLPALKASRKNIQYLTPQEIQKIRKALNDDASPLTLCDRAMGKLAMYTGLRGCDISALSLNSIDWDKDTISIIQQKTEVPQIIRLTAVVGNAIWDYKELERPHIENSALFLTQTKPYRNLEAASMWNASMRIMRAAGIRQDEGDRKGLHIFRHHFAVTLLGNNVSLPVISKGLGHLDPGSTEDYLSADFIHLKECALGIENFPVGEGVLGDE